jgi:hypothetical protein
MTPLLFAASSLRRRLASSRDTAARDIMEDSSRDHKGEACDAATMAMGFTAVHTRISDVAVTRETRVIECDASLVCD